MKKIRALAKGANKGRRRLSPAPGPPVGRARTRYALCFFSRNFMSYVPDICFMDAKFELISDKGQIKHVALTLYGYYCGRRNKTTGLCFPKLDKTARDTGIPKSNVSMTRTFLEKVGWIEIVDGDLIRPIKGFYSEEEIFKMRLKKLLFDRVSVLIIRTLVLKNRMFVLIIRTLFKGSLNQPIKPAHLTSSSAESAKRESATAHDANKFSPPSSEPVVLGEKISAKKPTPEKASAESVNKDHPAIRMIKEITGRYAPKDLWKRIIREVGDNPNTKFFSQSFEIWRGVGGNPQNFEKWLFEPNRTKLPPEIYGEKSPKNDDKKPDWQAVGKPPPEMDEVSKMSSKDLQIYAENFKTEIAIGNRDFVLEQEKYFTPEDWAWLISKISENL